MNIDQEYELVEVGRLQEHPRNPRRGDVEAIDESVEVNGWYGAVTAQVSTGYILAGNHRYRVAVRRGAEKVPTIWRDCDDQTALRILLADNKTADLGTYDEELLSELLEGLETLEGTGYDRELAAAEQRAEAGPEEASEGPEDEEVPDDKYVAAWAVLVECESEDQQREVYEKMRADGYENLRVVTV